MTLTTRLAIAMIALVAIAVSAVGWLNYRNLEQALLLRARDRIETHSRQLATDLEYYAASATGDVASFRSAAALHGLIRARRAGGIDPVDGVSEKTWRDRLASGFAAELEAKPTYAMLRIIGLDDDGRELVRVDRAGPNDTIRIVPEEGLLERNSRSYFPETIQLGPTQIYVSPLDLGRRNGLIEAVHRPTLRIATPIFADDGKPFGLFMINVDMRRAFDRVRSSVLPGETIYVVNKQGDYLVHPDRSREFGWLLGKPNDWKADFPHLASQAGATQGSADIVPDQAARPGGIALAAALLAGVEWVGVIETAPNAVIMAPAASIRNTSLLVGGIAVLCAAVLALVIARSLTRPIVQLTEAVQGVASNKKIAIPVDARGETGVLARAFAQAIGEVNAKTAALEREVQEHRRTERRATIMPSGSGCSARRSNPPTTPSSRRRSTAPSPAGTRRRSGCSDTARRKPRARTSRCLYPKIDCRSCRTRCAGSAGAKASKPVKQCGCEKVASGSKSRSASPRSSPPQARPSASRRWRATSPKPTRPGRCCGGRPKSFAASSRPRRI